MTGEPPPFGTWPMSYPNLSDAKDKRIAELEAELMRLTGHERDVDAAVAAEREACAKLVEEFSGPMGTQPAAAFYLCQEIAEAIRARAA